jgi:hypothetical protein
MANPKVSEKRSPTGRIRVYEHAAGSADLFMRLKAWAGKDPARTAVAMDAVRTGRLACDIHNLIMESGLTGTDLIVQFLGGNLATGMPNAAYQGGINWGAIGTGVATPAVTDSELGAEVARSSVLFFQDSAFSQAVFQFFFPDGSIPNQTYTEFGSFMGATATLNSGNIFNHALLSPTYVKTAGTDVTVELTISI